MWLLLSAIKASIIVVVDDIAEVKPVEKAVGG